VVPKLVCCWVATATALCAFAVGCAGRQSGPMLAPALPSMANKPPVVQGLPSSALASSNPVKSENAFTSTIKKGWSATTAAFTPKPKVIPARDPISLAAGPAVATPELCVSAARMLEQAGKPTEARKQYEKALKLDATNLDALLGLGHLYDRQGDLTSAGEYYRKAVQFHPGKGAPHNDLGLCYARQGMLPESAAALTKAVNLQPRKGLYRNNLATVLVELNRPDEALQQMAATHDQATAYYNIGFLLAKKGQNQAAASYFSQALQLNPQMTSARQWLIRLGAAPAVQAHQAPATNAQAQQVAAATNRWDRLGSGAAPQWSVAASQQPATPPLPGEGGGFDAASNYVDHLPPVDGQTTGPGW